MLKENDHVLEYVDAYLHGVLSPGDADTVERHCQQCPICQVALGEAQKRQAALQNVPVVEASDRLITATEERIVKYTRRNYRTMPPWRMTWIGVAAAACLIGIVHMFFLFHSASPYDLRVLGQSDLLSGSTASLRVVLINPYKDQALEGVPVEIALSSADGQRTLQLASFKTDRLGSGAPSFQLPDWESGEYHLRIRALPGGTPEEITNVVTLRREWQLMLSCDKPVYQPGQTIRVRSMALRRPERKPVAGQEVVYSIIDPKGNTIFRSRDVTSRFGIASAECPLADEIREGAYQLQCQMGDTHSTRTVEVQKYVLPKFKLDVTLDHKYYEPGQRITGTVQADYFFGQPVANGQLDIELQVPGVVRNVDQTVKVQTDAKGKGAFELMLPNALIGREQDSGDARVTLLVKLRDSSGQEQSTSVSRIVTAQPIRIEVLPEAGNLVKGVASTVYLFTARPDGQPVKTRLAISGIEREVSTNELGVAAMELTPNANTQNLTIRATDEEGKIGRRSVALQCGQVAEDFLVRTDKAVYDSGDSLDLVALGGGVEPVFVDLLKDGQTVLTDSIAMSNGRGEYQFTLPAELSGTLQVCAYRFGGQGLPVRKIRTIYVRPAQGVKIQTKLSQDQYRPGERARLQFTLTDDQGRPAPGALSLAAVDEAVYRILQSRPGMERAFAALEEELLEPVYAIYPWSPDSNADLPPAERRRFEQAIFAATARDLPNVRAASLRHGAPRDDEDDFPERARISPQPKTAGKIGGNVAEDHSLVATTFPAKQVTADHERQVRLSTVSIAWVILAVVAGALLLLMLLGKRTFAILAGIGACVLVVAALLLPALNMVKEAARNGRVTAKMDMRADRVPAEKDVEDPFSKGTAEAGSSAPPRVRRWFPETLLWRPELITDDHGHASLDLDLADSITTWRLSASAITAGGRFGSAEQPIRVFQPFFVELNLPVTLTREDEVAIPVVVYNYLDRPQTVELKFAEQPALELLGDPMQKLELAAGEVRSTSYRLRAKLVGEQSLEVHATANGIADAIKRQIEVVPDGRRVEEVFNGVLRPSADIDLTIPDTAVPGSAKTLVKIYPSTFSQVVEGLDGIFQRPSGCFEQTSSTTYPNVLALGYLRKTNKSLSEVEAKARQYIHLGYQRLLSFEIAGGGFDWFGHPPANRTLTAYGLLEFVDMAKIHDVDPALIQRTRNWLLSQRQADGSWEPEDHRLHDDPTHGNDDLARLSATAYIAWAVSAGQPGGDSSGATLRYLVSHEPPTIDDPYVLALVAKALGVFDPRGDSAAPYFKRLDSLKKVSADGKLVWWELAGDRRTTFYGGGRAGNIEATALAALSMIEAGQYPGTTRSALAWLVQQRDAQGTWHSTQATVLALKALLAGAGKPMGGDRPREIELALDGKPLQRIRVPAAEADVMKQVDISAQVGSGSHRLTITDRSDAAPGYQVTTRHYIPADGPAATQKQPPLSIELSYGRNELRQGETVGVTATVVNNLPDRAPMIVLDLPIPAGFTTEAADFDQLVAKQVIAKHQQTPRSVIVYLRELPPQAPLTLKYRLRATMPVKATAQAAWAYEYYDPDKRVASRTTQLTVNP